MVVMRSLPFKLQFNLTSLKFNARGDSSAQSLFSCLFVVMAHNVLLAHITHRLEYTEDNQTEDENASE